MKRIHETEVLVTGAGPVGLLTAILLADAGVRVQVIDKATGPVTRSCACLIHPASLALLERAGVIEPAIAAGYPIHKIAFHAGANRVADVALQALDDTFPMALALPQDVFERLLEDRFRRISGHGVMWNHRLSKVTVSRDGMIGSIDEIGTSSGGIIVAEVVPVVESEMEMHTVFVVGADGNDSVVRTDCKIEMEHFGSRSLFRLDDFESDPARENEAHVLLDDDAPGMLVPLSQGKFRLTLPIGRTHGFVEAPKKQRSHFTTAAARGDTSQLKQMLSMYAPWFKHPLKALDWEEEVPFEPRLAKRYGEGRCWMAGDSAHEGSPVASQSMNAGLADAAELADAMTRVLREVEPPTLLGEYGRRRRGAWKELRSMHERLRPGSKTAPEIKRCWFSVPDCLPAFGQDLARLLRELGAETAELSGRGVGRFRN